MAASRRAQELVERALNSKEAFKNASKLSRIRNELEKKKRRKELERLRELEEQKERLEKAIENIEEKERRIINKKGSKEKIAEAEEIFYEDDEGEEEGEPEGEDIVDTDGEEEEEEEETDDDSFVVSDHESDGERISYREESDSDLEYSQNNRSRRVQEIRRNYERLLQGELVEPKYQKKKQEKKKKEIVTAPATTHVKKLRRNNIILDDDEDLQTAVATVEKKQQELRQKEEELAQLTAAIEEQYEKKPTYFTKNRKKLRKALKERVEAVKKKEKELSQALAIIPIQGQEKTTPQLPPPPPLVPVPPVEPSDIPDFVVVEDENGREIEVPFVPQQLPQPRTKKEECEQKRMIHVNRVTTKNPEGYCRKAPANYRPFDKSQCITGPRKGKYVIRVSKNGNAYKYYTKKCYE